MHVGHLLILLAVKSGAYNYLLAYYLTVIKYEGKCVIVVIVLC